MAREVAAVVLQGVQVAIVVGGGNYFRGANAWVSMASFTTRFQRPVFCLTPPELIKCKVLQPESHAGVQDGLDRTSADYIG